MLLVRVGAVILVAVQKATGSPYGDEDFASRSFCFLEERNAKTAASLS